MAEKDQQPVAVDDAEQVDAGAVIAELQRVIGEQAVTIAVLRARLGEGNGR